MPKNRKFSSPVHHMSHGSCDQEQELLLLSSSVTYNTACEKDQDGSVGETALQDRKEDRLKLQFNE
jgi:hypothetical protein